MLIKPEVIYTGIPFDRVTLLESNEGNLINYTGIKECIDEELPSPVGIKSQGKVRFWRDVQQLYFNFEGYDKAKNINDWLRIQEFCQQFGYFLPPDLRSSQVPTAESWDECKLWLKVFYVLTTIVEQAKRGRLEPLWDLISKAKSEYEGEERKFVPLTEAFSYNRIVIGIDMHPWEECQANQPQRVKMKLWPSNNNELLFVIWNSALNTILKMLQLIPLHATGRENSILSQNDRPLITWAFSPRGNILSAFVQWYLQEIAPFNINICAADNCSMPVIKPKKNYCSSACRERMKKRRHRNRNK